MALAQPELISLAAGFVDQATPAGRRRRSRRWRPCFADATRGRAALQYGTNAGYLPLREAVLARLIAADGKMRGRGRTSTR